MHHMEVKQKTATYKSDILGRELHPLKMSCMKCFYLQPLLLVFSNTYYIKISLHPLIALLFLFFFFSSHSSSFFSLSQIHNKIVVWLYANTSR